MCVAAGAPGDRPWVCLSTPALHMSFMGSGYPWKGVKPPHSLAPTLGSAGDQRWPRTEQVGTRSTCYNLLVQGTNQGQLRSSWERALPAEARGPGSFLTCPGLGESLTSNHIEERGRERGMPRGGAGGGITPAHSLSLSPSPHLTSGEAGVEEKGPPEHLEGLAPAGVWGG